MSAAVSAVPAVMPPMTESDLSACLASPKSSTLAWLRLVTKMFAGLMSR